MEFIVSTNNLSFPCGSDVILNSVDKSDIGKYQCLASNVHGVALSGVIELREAVFQADPLDSPKSLRVDTGHSLILKYRQPISVPEASVIWGIVGNEGKIVPIQLDDRISLDSEGKLHLMDFFLFYRLLFCTISSYYVSYHFILCKHL